MVFLAGAEAIRCLIPLLVWEQVYFLLPIHYTDLFFQCNTQLDCKTVVFFSLLKITWVQLKSLTRAKRRASHARDLAPLFQPRSRPFVWLLARTYGLFCKLMQWHGNSVLCLHNGVILLWPESFPFFLSYSNSVIPAKITKLLICSRKQNPEGFWS